MRGISMPVDTSNRWMNFVAGSLALLFASASVFGAVAPYFGLLPQTADTTLLTQAQAAVQNITLIIIGFFFGGSVTSRKKDEAIANQAATLAATTPPQGTP
jgi:hypothetical protein